MTEHNDAETTIRDLQAKLATREAEIAENRVELEKATTSFRTVLALKNRKIKDLEQEIRELKEGRSVEEKLETLKIEDLKPEGIEVLQEESCDPVPQSSSQLANQFIGTYYSISIDNMDAYLQEVGFGLITRTLACKLNPTLTFEINGEEWTMTLSSAIQTQVTKFKLGVEFDLRPFNGRNATAKFEFEGPKLVQTEKGRGEEKDCTIVRTIDGNILTVIAECNGVKMTRVYERA